MALSGYCPICSKGMSVVNEVKYEFRGNELKICYNCSEEIAKLSSPDDVIKEKAKLYFRNMQEKNKPQKLGVPLVKSLLEGEVSEEELKAPAPVVKKEIPEPSQPAEVLPKPQASDEASTATNGSLKVAGVIFLIIAVVWYYISVVDVDGFKVANIQSTVFAAASAVISAVCFVGARIITVLDSRK